MMPIRTVRLAITTACAVVLVGCASMAPRYERPASPVPSQFHDAPASGSMAAPVASLSWQQVFIDPKLQQVIALALNNNRDLRVAVLNIEKARAEYRIRRADLFPIVSADHSQTKHRNSAADRTSTSPHHSHS